MLRQWIFCYIFVSCWLGYYAKHHFKSEWDEQEPKVSYSHEKSSTNILLDRKLMVYNDELYTPWSDWSNCSIYECKEKRFRECRDDSYTEPIKSLLRLKICPFKYIAEARSCLKRENCRIHAGPSETLRGLESSCGLLDRDSETREDQEMKIHMPWIIDLYKTVLEDEVDDFMKPRKLSGSRICSASLLSQDYILTSASCLQSVIKSNLVPLGRPFSLESFGEFTIFARVSRDGKEDPESSVRDHLIESAIIHPLWQPRASDGGFNVALVKLADPITTDEKAGTICLPEENSTLLPDSECFVISHLDGRKEHSRGQRWGYFGKHIRSHLFYNFFDEPLMPRQVDTPSRWKLTSVSAVKCQKQFSKFEEDVHVCAKLKEKGSGPIIDTSSLYCKNNDSEQWSIYGVTKVATTSSHYMLFNSAIRLSKWIHQLIQ